MDLELVLTASIGIVVVLLFYVGLDHRNRNRFRLPPGPLPWPLIGNLGLLGPLPHQDFAKLAKKYGPLMLLRLGQVPTVIVSSPQIAEEILKTRDLIFASRPTIIQAEIMAYGSQSIGFAPYGPTWRFLRKVLALELLTNKRLDAFARVRKEEVLSGLSCIIEECQGGKPVLLHHKFIHIAQNNITRMCFNKAYFGPNSSAADAEEGVKYIEILKEIFRLYGVFNIGDYIPSLQKFDLQGYQKAMQRVVEVNDEFFGKIIKEHREVLQNENRAPDMMDMVDVLLSRPNAADDKPFTDNQIKAILIDIILGATDTTATTLEWAFAELIRQPHVLRKAQKELDSVVGQDRLVEESDIPRLEYCRAIVKEVFRLHSPGPLMMPHESMAACEVGGYCLPAKCRVFVNTWAIGRDSAVWERPLDFDPDRFLTSNINIHGQDFQLLPFGAGRRGCPGKSLGLLLVEYTMAALIHGCDWSLEQGHDHEKLDLTEGPGLTTPLAVPLEAVATPRLPIQVISAHA